MIKKRGKLKGLVVLVFLILVLGFIDSAWIIYHKSTITAEIIGKESVYTISQKFDNVLSLDTRNDSSNITTLMKIEGLTENINMSFNIETRTINLTSGCPNYNDDCKVVVTQIFSNGARNILSDTDHYDVNEEANFTLFKNINNIIEYRIECIENSCPQRINSTITLSEVR